MNSHLAHAIDDWRAAGGPGRHQVAGHFRLAINHHTLAVSQLAQCDGYPLAVKQKLHPMMHQAFGIHPLRHARFA